ncbi:hypothetical protein [uncultured Microscilla sp.]|uniref:hypothetical protein n=1 Tax=uncultured Microscilla sp. TaxID=432653 RepID=UPI0026340FB7|nr:hypothetical protein [uncultured Microscilla sp.]
MKVKNITHYALTENILPDIIIQRTLGQLPLELKQLYLDKKNKGLKVGVGLDMQLGFYLILYTNTFQVELLWWENQVGKVAVA